MEGEQRFRPAWRSFYNHQSAILILFVAVIVAQIEAGLPPIYQKIMWILFIVAVLLILLNMVYKRYRIVLIVRPHEIALEEGFISRNSVEISMKSIRTIKINQTLTQRMMNIGNLLVASSGTDKYEINIPNMPDPNKIRDIMQQKEDELQEKEAKEQENKDNGANPDPKKLIV